jgi:hypothetical protein
VSHDTPPIKKMCNGIDEYLLFLINNIIYYKLLVIVISLCLMTIIHMISIHLQSIDKKHVLMY